MKKKFALDVSELKVVFGNGNTNRSQDKKQKLTTQTVNIINSSKRLK